MASNLSHIFFSVFLFGMFFLNSSSTHARYANHQETAFSTKQQAERLIRSFNLFPKTDINVVEDESSVVDAPGVLVEKQFQFPSLAGSGPSIQDLGHYAGYYRLPQTKGARMFYFFFESRNKNTDPIVIWLTGGPGCGSEITLFYENGPFHIAKNMSLVWNDYGWDKVSNILFVDQPTGTGFSYTTSESDIRHDETGVSNDLYNFLQEFFKAHPQFT
ncbi:serine carboxypeptidase-like 47, partial [Tripterygium wilfordii]|uniref:serine carboxypeptidase-like 47 n=1 Tax=Tripterygium wilfordii TaxID=458696 RepID=UPI0018F83337